MSILCYHEVDPEWGSPLALTPSAFMEHCRWLARKRTIVDVETAGRLVRPSGTLPRGLAALTFDDGLAGLHQHALPVLVSTGLPATVFLVAETLVPGGRPVDWIDGLPRGARRTLTAEQVLDMQQAGITFGSHSYSHRDLRELSDAECEHDLRLSREVLEEVVGRPVRTLAYPRGFHNGRVRAAAQRAGFSYAFGIDQPTEARDRWCIPRIGTYRHNGLATLRIKTSRWYPAVRTSRAFGVVGKTLPRTMRSLAGR